MAHEVTGTLNVAEAIQGPVRQVDLSHAVADRMGWQLVRESLGSAGTTSKESRAACSTIKDRLGIAPSEELFRDQLDVSFRGGLGRLSGCEVTP
jgi:hypothetical protein